MGISSWKRGFVVNSDEAQTKGSAVWLIKNRKTCRGCSSGELSFVDGNYIKTLEGKETKVSEDDYYGFVNTIIKITPN